MKNKKGVEFLGEHVVNVIIAVIIIILLVIVGLKIYGLFVKEGQDIEQAKAQLIKIKEIVDETYATGQPQIIETFFTPAKGWYVRSFYDFNPSEAHIPQGACLGQIGCLCICKDFSCEGPHACIGTEYDLKFLAPHVVENLNDPNLESPGGITVYKEYLSLSESIYQIRTSIGSDEIVLVRPISR